MVWSLPIRILHWSIAMIVILNVFGLEDGDPPHRYLGYGAVIFLLVRVYFGIRGKGEENFSKFPLRPTQILDHFRGKIKEYPGHNPLASLVYLFMWLSILGLGVTGWMSGLDAFWGDDGIKDIHKWISWFLVLLICTHLCGVILDSILFKRKTWLAMVTGKKR